MELDMSGVGEGIGCDEIGSQEIGTGAGERDLGLFVKELV
jgi:hypothetical protein